MFIPNVTDRECLLLVNNTSKINHQKWPVQQDFLVVVAFQNKRHLINVFLNIPGNAVFVHT